MRFINKFSSNSGELNFRLINSNSKKDLFISTTPSYGGHCVLVDYLKEDRLINIRSIEAGSNKLKIRKMTSKTIETLIGNLEVDSIGFLSVREIKTRGVIFRNNLDQGIISNLNDYKKSPFLRSLNEFGYLRFRADFNFKTRKLLKDDYLIGFKD